MSEIRNRANGRRRESRQSSADDVQQDQGQQQPPQHQLRSPRNASPRSRQHRPHSSSSDFFSSAVIAGLLLSTITAFILYQYFSNTITEPQTSSARDDIPKSDPIQKRLKIPFETAFTGGKLSIQLDGLVRVCSSCQGTGAAPGAIHFCTACQGTGERITQAQIFGGGPLIHIRQQCSRCQGTGKMITKYCPRCNGRRTTVVQYQLDIPIHAGARSGDLIRIEGQGNHLPDHSAGDLVFIIQIPTESGPFKLVDNNITTTVPIALREALLGFRKSIRHVNGDSIVVDQSHRVTDPKTVVTFKGQGWPKSRDGRHPAGDLLVEFEIDYPSSISADNVDLLKRTFAS